VDDDMAHERSLTWGERNRRLRDRTERALAKARSDRLPLVAGGPEREAYAWSVAEVLLGGAMVAAVVVGAQWALRLL